MAEMTRIERVLATVAGERPDRPAVSFWHHFEVDCHSGKAAVDAHLKFLRRYDIDFLKVMNDNGYPTCRDVRSAADLRDMPVLSGDEEGYGLQLELLRSLSAELKGEVLLTTTMFNAWAVLRRLVSASIAHRHGPPNLSGQATPADVRMNELVTEDRGIMGMALDAIAASQANFARKCLESGADGIFLSVRDDWIDTDAQGKGTYDELIRTGDGQILSAARAGRFNMLHVCGLPRDFDSFAAYPVHAINWADRVGGPAIGEVVGRVKPAVCGGVDNLGALPDGTPARVEAEVRDALQQAGDRPIMISAGCTFDPDKVPGENLDAMVKAARAHRY